MTVFMKRLRTGVARTTVFQVHPSTFEEAVSVALNAEFHFKAVFYVAPWNTSSSSDKADLMNLMRAGEKAEP